MTVAARPHAFAGFIESRQYRDENGEPDCRRDVSGICTDTKAGAMDQRTTEARPDGAQSDKKNADEDAARVFSTSILENSNDLVAAVDTNLCFVALNDHFRREFELIFGVPVKPGARLDDVLEHLTSDRDKAAALFHRALAGESFRVVEEFGDQRLLRKCYEIAFTPIFDTYHNVILAAFVVRDLSMVRVTEQRFGVLLEAAPDATLIMRADGTIDLANAHAERMFGYGRREMIGLPVENLIPERFRARHIAQRHKFMLRPLARPMGSRDFILLGLRTDGSEFPVEISLNPLEVTNDTMVVAAVRDMTARQRAEDELRALSVELEKRVLDRTAELEKANKAFRATFEQASVGVAHVAPDGKWLRVNQRLCDIVGYSRDEMGTLTFQDLTHPDDLNVDVEMLYRVLAGDLGFYAIDKRYVRKDGGIVWINLNVSLVRDDFGAPLYFIAVVESINDRKLAEESLQRSKESLELAIDATGLGLFDYYPQTGRVDWSPEMKRLYGLPRDAQVDYDMFIQALHPEDRARVHEGLQAAMRDPSLGRFHQEHRVIRVDDGKERWIDARGQIVFDHARKPVRCIGTALDITDKKSTEERIRASALHDTLTGLPNRGLLYECARHVFGRARRSGHHCGVLFVDLDRFKPINDNHGHEVGDEVLREVARRLLGCTRQEDHVFRLGGDEFLIMLTDIVSDTDAGEVARHMSHCINQPYYVSGLSLSLSPSVGIALFPRDGQDLDMLISNADAAMYQAKQEGRNSIQFYSAELAAKSQMQLKIEEQLKSALNQNAFLLHYQPLIDMSTRRLVAVEALIRWPGSNIGPEQFVPIAEATGHIRRLGEWVIAEACRQHKTWCEHGLPPISIAVNVSAVQFRQNDFAEEFVAQMNNYAVGMDAVQVEVTETALMENLDRAIAVLTRLRTLGVTISLDDFGTGYSSLSYLSRLPVHKIKVDKSFVQHIEDDMASRAVAEAVIALGKTLKLDVVAEGIESESTLRHLRRHGCNQAQGFHVCKPISAADFESWYEDYRANLLP